MYLTPTDKITGRRLNFEVDQTKLLRPGRGHPVGTHLGDVTDLRTGRRYRITQASCGSEHCNCDAQAEELDKPTAGMVACAFADHFLPGDDAKADRVAAMTNAVLARLGARYRLTRA